MTIYIKGICLDQDGVLADFDQGFKNLYGVHPGDYEAEHGQIRFWEKVYQHPRFFETLPMLEDPWRLIIRCQRYAGGKENVMILSSPSKTNTPLCMIQKRNWIDRNLSYDFPAIFEKDKHKYASPGRVLIDDTQSKIDKWIQAGGEGILYKNYLQCLNELHDIHLKLERKAKQKEEEK
jgi:hypothetical protein